MTVILRRTRFDVPVSGLSLALHESADPALVSRQGGNGSCLLSEGVLDLLASAFEVGLPLVVLAPDLSAPVAGDPADRFFGLAAKLLRLVLGLIRCAHCVCSYFAGIVRVADRPDAGYLASCSPNVKWLRAHAFPQVQCERCRVLAQPSPNDFLGGEGVKHQPEYSSEDSLPADRSSRLPHRRTHCRD